MNKKGRPKHNWIMEPYNNLRWTCKDINRRVVSTLLRTTKFKFFSMPRKHRNTFVMNFCLRVGWPKFHHIRHIELAFWDTEWSYNRDEFLEAVPTFVSAQNDGTFRLKTFTITDWSRKGNDFLEIYGREGSLRRVIGGMKGLQDFRLNIYLNRNRTWSGWQASRHWSPYWIKEELRNEVLGLTMPRFEEVE